MSLFLNLIFHRLTGPIASALCVILAASLPLSYCKGRADGWDAHKHKVEQAKAELEAANNAAHASAADQRLKDTLSTKARQEERDDAISSVPDEKPSGPELARACAILRQQGTAESRLPPVCRPSSPR